MIVRLLMIVTMAGFFLAAEKAEAIPLLQLYVENGVYDQNTESWVTATLPGEPVRIWAIGNVDGPGGKGDISNVRMSIAYDAAHLGLSATLTPSQVGGLGVGVFNGVSDPSVPSAPIAGSLVTDGSSPLISGSTSLPPHGVFGPGVVWQEFSLGNFTLTDSHIGDFIDSFPTELFPNAGQINAYDVTITGGAGAQLHFDLYGIGGPNSMAVFAPFSHDAEVNVVPAPSSLVIWPLLLGVGMAVNHVRRRRSANRQEVLV
jgi:hypothetical protein